MEQTTTTPVLVKTYRYAAALDNHSPCHRSQADGVIEEWFWPEYDELRYVLRDGAQFRDAVCALFLLDDGTSVSPLYVAGWSQDTSQVYLHHFPVNVDRDGAPLLRHGRPVDFSTWMLGPRRAYHLKITEV